MATDSVLNFVQELIKDDSKGQILLSVAHSFLGRTEPKTERDPSMTKLSFFFT